MEDMAKWVTQYYDPHYDRDHVGVPILMPFDMLKDPLLPMRNELVFKCPDGDVIAYAKLERLARIAITELVHEGVIKGTVDITKDSYLPAAEWENLLWHCTEEKPDDVNNVILRLMVHKSVEDLAEKPDNKSTDALEFLKERMCVYWRKSYRNNNKIVLENYSFGPVQEGDKHGRLFKYKDGTIDIDTLGIHALTIFHMFVIDPFYGDPFICKEYLSLYYKIQTCEPEDIADHEMELFNYVCGTLCVSCRNNPDLEKLLDLVIKDPSTEAAVRNRFVDIVNIEKANFDPNTRDAIVYIQKHFNPSWEFAGGNIRTGNVNIGFSPFGINYTVQYIGEPFLYHGERISQYDVLKMASTAFMRYIIDHGLITGLSEIVRSMQYQPLDTMTITAFMQNINDWSQRVNERYGIAIVFSVKSVTEAEYQQTINEFFQHLAF